MRYRNVTTIIVCSDCNLALLMRSNGLFSQDWPNSEWLMLNDHVWATAQRKSTCRFLCVGCTEERLGRRLSAFDFRRTAKVNFTGHKSACLRRRMKGLRPAKRLTHTTFRL